ncbi:MAG: MBL fold metallo-hydrolase [Bacillota bacterium]
MIINEVVRVMRPSRGSLVYVLRTEMGLVIVDTGSEPKAAPILINYVKNRLHESPEQIKYIFLTHWHGDHSGAAQKIRELTGARIICHQDDSHLLAGTTRIEYCWNKPMPRSGLNPLLRLVCAAGYRMMKANTDPLQPDMVVEDGAMPFGSEWRVIHLPGHTPGSCGLWSARRRILFAGDTVLSAGKRMLVPPVPFLIQEPEKLYDSWCKLSRLGEI